MINNGVSMITRMAWGVEIQLGCFSILKYHRKKVVWDLVSAGRTTDQVIDLMYGVWLVNKRIKYNQWLA
jgi:hypothetical protein